MRAVGTDEPPGLQTTIRLVQAVLPTAAGYVPEADIEEVLVAGNTAHFLAQRITETINRLSPEEQVERVKSLFDEYDRENGYTDEEDEQDYWSAQLEVINSLLDVATQCLRCDLQYALTGDVFAILSLIKYKLEHADER
mgnify:FL=1